MRVTFNGQHLVLPPCASAAGGWCEFERWAAWAEARFSDAALAPLCAVSASADADGTAWLGLAGMSRPALIAIGTLGALLVSSLLCIATIVARERRSGRAMFAQNSYKLVEMAGDEARNLDGALDVLSAQGRVDGMRRD